MNIQSSLISLAVGVLIPGLVALVTRTHASDGLKALISAMAAAATGALNGALSSVPAHWTQWEAILWQVGLAWISAAVIYLTGYKPSGIASWIHVRTEPFGLGPRSEAGMTDGGMLVVALLVGGLLGAALGVVIGDPRQIVVSMVPGVLAVALWVFVRRTAARQT